MCRRVCGGEGNEPPKSALGAGQAQCRGALRSFPTQTFCESIIVMLSMAWDWTGVSPEGRSGSGWALWSFHRELKEAAEADELLWKHSQMLWEKNNAKTGHVVGSWG